MVWKVLVFLKEGTIVGSCEHVICHLALGIDWTNSESVGFSRRAQLTAVRDLVGYNAIFETQIFIVSGTFSTLCQGVEVLHIAETTGNCTAFFCTLY